MNNPFNKPLFKVSNNFKISEKACTGPNNYFKQCLDNNNAIYGSDKHIKEECPVITGTPDVPCNSLWNNLTRRKSLINY